MLRYALCHSLLTLTATFPNGNLIGAFGLFIVKSTFLIFGNSFNNALVVCSATASIKSNLFSVKNLFINLHAFA